MTEVNQFIQFPSQSAVPSSNSPAEVSFRISSELTAEHGNFQNSYNTPTTTGRYE
jgi:hypothetical protein